MKKITSLFLSFLCAFALVGCGGNEEPSNNQNTEWSTIKEATCTEEGLKEKYINGELIQESIPVLGHDYGEWNVTLKETCTTDGKEERQCSRCSSKEEKIIEAHHVLKDGCSFDIDTHYYECNNCTEKIDLANHNFTVNKEDKYAYFLDDNSLFESLIMVNVGYISTLNCDECDVKITDYNLVDKYYFANESHHYIKYLDCLGVKTNQYDLKYGLCLFYYSDFDYIKFEYDSNFNITNVSTENTTSVSTYSVKYTYKYDENNNLSKVEVEQDIFKGYNFTFDLKYTENKLLEVVYNAVYIVNNTNNQVVFNFDNDGNLIKQTNYQTINSQQLKYKELIFNNGHLEKQINWDYNSSGEILNEIAIEYGNNFDGNGNLLNHSSKFNNLNVSCTYDGDNRITSIGSISNNFTFEYENDKLFKMTYNTLVYTYQYSDNKVSAYDSNNNLALEIEYISDYKIVD